MGVKRRHLDIQAVRKEHIPTYEIPLDRITKATLQYGKTSVSFPFAAAGEENVSATITFPTAFAAAPLVVANIEGIDVGIVKIATTTSNFTITVRDDKGTDYTTSQTATVHWIAIKP